MAVKKAVSRVIKLDKLDLLPTTVANRVVICQLRLDNIFNLCNTARDKGEARREALRNLRDIRQFSQDAITAIEKLEGTVSE